MGFPGSRQYMRWSAEKGDTEFHCLHEVFHLSPLLCFYFLPKMRNVFKCMLIAQPALRIEKAVGRGCRTVTPSRGSFSP